MGFGRPVDYLAVLTGATSYKTAQGVACLADGKAVDGALTLRHPCCLFLFLGELRLGGSATTGVAKAILFGQSEDSVQTNAEVDSHLRVDYGGVTEFSHYSRIQRSLLKFHGYFSLNTSLLSLRKSKVFRAR